MMNFREARQHYSQLLHPLYEAREAEAITDLVLESVTGKSRLQRITDRDACLTGVQQSRLQAAFDRLRLQAPVQYVLEEAWFHDLRLRVNEEVLIPRPETEELVEWIIQDQEKAPSKAQQLIDAGTGSGCIAIALKKTLPDLQTTGTDISAGALAVAAGNASRYGLDIGWIKADMLDETTWPAMPGCDILVSNPPYIRRSEAGAMAPHVRDHEPAQALFVPDEDPLLFYRALARLACRKLRPGGALYVEINEALGDSVAALFRKAGLNPVVLRQDLFGKDRMVKGSLG
ncbi:peptide chain release factor N(5)-glutamine methyltransferase [Compostibacter hankyongensis]